VNARPRYAAIVERLSPDALTELWCAALFGRPLRAELRGSLAALQALRCDVGRASAAQFAR